jgi:hypothetical protein
MAETEHSIIFAEPLRRISIIPLSQKNLLYNRPSLQSYGARHTDHCF